ncbi:MAG: PQQ-dependent sugar dehydrogenase [Planctomycetes bacterium]|nr:PQQ-dependent sugar dehydrogenase [Planctomycetota bacterium]
MTASFANAQTTPVKTVLFANGFSSPIYVAAPPNDFDHLYVVERAGKIKCIDAKTGALLSTFLDITSLTSTTGERGLLCMAFHPQYDINGSNKKFYLYYTNTAGNIVIAKYDASTATTANTVATIIITVNHPSFSNHNGGCVRFGPDGFLYFAPGDGGSENDPSNNGANINVLLGKMLRIDVDNPSGGNQYGIPATNPYASMGTGMKEIYFVGMRNVFRFTFDRNTGDMYMGDVGQNAWEEIDYCSASYVPTPGTPRHYGWRCFEGFHQTSYSGCVYPNAYPGFTTVFPISEYAHAGPAAVMGGTVYHGCALPDWRGQYFYADNSTSKIWTFKYTGTASPPITDRTSQFAPGGGLGINSITGICEDASGELYFIDMNGGELFKFVPQSPPVIVGVSTYGSGTNGCSGAHAIGVNSTPCVNNNIFKMTATNCPQSTLGLAIVTDQQDLVGSDPFSIGVTFLVGFGGSNVIPLDATSDNLGNGTVPAAIPNSAFLAGQTFFGQTYWVWSPSTCTLPGFNVYNMSSSNGVAFTIQP